jgi:NAD(P)-dependent dehydrogenase (short-subunit alcohol dehydrogenase family)
MGALSGKVALVAGATRGAGRGIACALGEAGATVYCSGRSARGSLASGPQRPETIEETAERVTAAGGRGVAVRTDHTSAEQVEALVARIAEDAGRLDVLVNDVWGGDELTEFGKTFWEVSLDKGRLMLERAVVSHVVTSRLAVPLMLETGVGLIVVGRAVAALTADPTVKRKSGRVFSSWNLAREYGFTDADGSRPDWGAHFEKTYGRLWKACDEGFYAYWADGPTDIVFPDWPEPEKLGKAADRSASRSASGDDPPSASRRT